MAREMKDSGIEWIGEIPENWDTIKVKFTSTLRGRIGWQGLTSSEYIDDGPFLVTGTDLLRGMINWETCAHISDKRFDEDTDIHIVEDDLLITKDGTIGKVAIVKNCPEKATLNSGVLLIRNIKEYKFFNRYMYYVLLSDEFWRWYTLSQTGQSTIKHLYQAQFYNFEFSYPPFDEQQRIASFLDIQCAHIDAVIELTRVSIEEYKKLKQAVITQAVTKGIRLGREMKDSGIEWIGEIPKDWEQKRFKYIASVKSNLVSPDDYGDFPQVSPENIEKGTGRLLPCRTVSEVGVISGNHLFYKGQILYSKIRPKLNKVAIAPFDGLCSADMYPIETIINKIFFVYALRAESFLAYIDLITEDRVKMPKINQEELANIYFVVPSMEEQDEIVDYLDKNIKKIDALIQQKEDLQVELESYKKSLIFEYVTGKKEVPA